MGRGMLGDVGGCCSLGGRKVERENGCRDGRKGLQTIGRELLEELKGGLQRRREAAYVNGMG